jgi:hypothetical protein
MKVVLSLFISKDNSGTTDKLESLDQISSEKNIFHINSNFMQSLNLFDNFPGLFPSHLLRVGLDFYFLFVDTVF